MANDKAPSKKNSKKDYLLVFGLPAGLVVGIFIIALASSGPSQPAHRVTQQTSSPTNTSGSAVNLGGLKSGSFGPLYQQRIGDEITERFQKIEKKQKAQMLALQQKEQQDNERSNQMLEQIEKNQEALQAELQQRARRERDEHRSVQFFGGESAKSGAYQSSQFTQTPAQAMASGSAPLENTAMQKQKRRQLIVPMGFVTGRLLNGVDATGSGGVGSGISSSGTNYVLIDLTGRVYEANNYHANLQHCFVVAQAFPDFSTSRVEMKPSTLQCNLPNGQSVQWAIGGFVTYKGIEGVPGVVNENLKNEAIAQTLLGGIGGVASAVGQAQYTNTYSGSSGSGSSILTGNPYTAAAAGALNSGAQAGASALQSYFNLYQPSIQIGSDKKVTVVITTSEPLPSAGRELTTNFKEIG